MSPTCLPITEMAMEWTSSWVLVKSCMNEPSILFFIVCRYVLLPKYFFSFFSVLNSIIHFFVFSLHWTFYILLCFVSTKPDVLVYKQSQDWQQLSFDNTTLPTRHRHVFWLIHIIGNFTYFVWVFYILDSNHHHIKLHTLTSINIPSSWFL